MKITELIHEIIEIREIGSNFIAFIFTIWDVVPVHLAFEVFVVTSMGFFTTSAQPHLDSVVDPTVVGPEDEGSYRKIAIIEDKAKVIMTIIM